MSCKNLPAEDVEDCIRFIKVHAPTLDMSIPSDREKISYEVTKFLVSPDRKYKQDISRLEAEKQQIQQQTEAEKQQIQQQTEAEKQQIQQQAEAEKQQIQQNYNNLATKFQSLKEDFDGFKLKYSTKIRLGFSLFLGLVLEGIVLILASQYAQGQNIYQKVLNSWVFFTAAFVIAVFLGALIIGKERLNALGWPFTKIFK
jgi:exonuclease VII large subunit